MKKNPIFWISIFVLAIAVTMLVLDLFVPRKIVIGTQEGKTGRFGVKPDEESSFISPAEKSNPEPIVTETFEDFE
jgi:hypothetical protein